MRYKIVVITSHYLCQPTKDALSRIEPECDYVVVPYDNFEHISEVYEQYAGADGFLVSGRSALSAIQLHVRQPLKPMGCFQVDTAALYKALLQLVLKNREQDLSRVVMDALLLVEDGYTAADFLARSEVDSVDANIVKWVRQIGVQGVGGVEDAITQKLTALWEEGAIDMVICQYSSIIPVLEGRGIPYRYPFLSDYQLGECVRELLVKIELENLRAGLPAAVCIFPRHSYSATEEQMAGLSEAVEKFFRDHLVECGLRLEQGALCADLSVQNVRYFTQNYSTCAIGEHLSREVDFAVAVGYGIGSSTVHAVGNARAAAKESALSGRSFIKDEAGNFIGPLDSDARMVVSTRTVGDVGEIARRCSLSTMTIQKLMTNIRMSGTNKTTTQELSRRFGVTVRNANRILSNLEKGGCARIIYSQTNSTKGRPVKVYELIFEQE